MINHKRNGNFFIAKTELNMNKKLKLKIDDLKVESFVMGISPTKQFKGGSGGFSYCPGLCTMFMTCPCTADTCGDTCNPCSRAFTNCANNGCGPDNKD